VTIKRHGAVHQRADGANPTRAVAAQGTKRPEDAPGRKTNQDFIDALGAGLSASPDSRVSSPVLVVAGKFTVSLSRDENDQEERVAITRLPSPGRKDAGQGGASSAIANNEELAALQRALKAWAPSWNQNRGRDAQTKEGMLPKVSLQLDEALLKDAQASMHRADERLKAVDVADNLTGSFAKLGAADLIEPSQRYEGKLHVNIAGLGKVELQTNLRWNREEPKGGVTLVVSPDSARGGTPPPRQLTPTELAALRASLKKIVPEFKTPLRFFSPGGFLGPKTPADWEEVRKGSAKDAIQSFLSETEK
jgi:hypothetical protein